MKMDFRKQTFKLLTLFFFITFLLAIAVGCAGKEPAQPAGEQQAEQAAEKVAEEKPFYEGELITIIVATAEGGGYDTYGRLLASHLKKYLPGSTIIVQNIPGAGHIIGTNEIYHSDPDGLTFGIFNQGLITSQLIEAEGIKFDLKQMSWLCNASAEPRAFMLSTNAPFKDIEDIIQNNSTQEIILSAAGIGSSSYVDAMLITKMLELDNNTIVVGYEGTDAEMAMMRGEVHGTIGTADSLLPLAQTGDAMPILVIGNRPLEEFPDVPLLSDLVSEEYKALASFMVTQASISRPFAGPPGIPEDRLRILRDAMEKTWNDPELLADAEKLGRNVTFFNGEEVEQLVKGALDQPPDVIDLLKDIVTLD